MTRTLQQVIAEKYILTQKIAEAKIGTFPMPKIPNDFSVTDLVFFVCSFFSSLYREDGSADYRSPLKMGIKMRGIPVTDEQLEVVYQDVADFLNWLIPELKKDRS